ncbi:MAG: hypothetical protein KQA34_01385 [Candidatus Aenigmarchaeota archaeon]|nr:hypothetical protein [Candidatus Aenigmarchaeota archaeon]
MKKNKILYIFEKNKEKILFIILGVLSSFITYKFYFIDIIGLSIPLLVFLVFSYLLGRENKFFKIIEKYALIYFLSWIITLTILVNV